MSCQKRIHIYVMRLYGNWWYKLLFIEEAVEDKVPEEVWKKGKITFLSLNKAVLSNIYGTEGKQGLRHTFIEIMTGEAVTGSG